MKKTYMINDVVLTILAFFVCIVACKLGLGSFQHPHTGLIPFLSGLLLGLLALVDLVSGFFSKWKKEKGDEEIWAAINWKRLILTVILLLIYTTLLPTLGFAIDTFLLLLCLFRLVAPKPLWTALLASGLTTGIAYMGFKVLLSIQLPSGFLGF